MPISSSTIRQAPREGSIAIFAHVSQRSCLHQFMIHSSSPCLGLPLPCKAHHRSCSLRHAAGPSAKALCCCDTGAACRVRREGSIAIFACVSRGPCLHQPKIQFSSPCLGLRHTPMAHHMGSSLRHAVCLSAKALCCSEAGARVHARGRSRSAFLQSERWFEHKLTWISIEPHPCPLKTSLV